MIFSVLLSDILSSFANCECVILGDVTYGACCIDDFGAKALNCDLIIHYAHSCLIPITDCLLPTLYIFVDITIDIDHLIRTIEFNLPKETNPTIYLLGSIQFNSSLFVCKRALIERGYQKVSIPQTKPRSAGEILGCTAPVLVNKEDAQSQSYVVFVCDGRFHMESIMIQNPQLIFYQYNPFTLQLTIEEYDYDLMKKIRYKQIEEFRKAKCVGVLYGTLGRQGDEGILKRIVDILNEQKVEHYVICLNEITQEKIEKFPQCEAFVQIACPRLSIDWSNQFDKPMITPFELYVAMNKTHWNQYPMDYYSYNGGEWAHYPKKK